MEKSQTNRHLKTHIWENPCFFTQCFAQIVLSEPMIVLMRISSSTSCFYVLCLLCFTITSTNGTPSYSGFSDFVEQVVVTPDNVWLLQNSTICTYRRVPQSPDDLFYQVHGRQDWWWGGVWGWLGCNRTGQGWLEGSPTSALSSPSTSSESSPSVSLSSSTSIWVKSTFQNTYKIPNQSKNFLNSVSCLSSGPSPSSLQPLPQQS